MEVEPDGPRENRAASQAAPRAPIRCSTRRKPTRPAAYFVAVELADFALLLLLFLYWGAVQQRLP